VVTEAELKELLGDCPTLYHMAERQSWPAICKHGLLSTTALLDRYGITGAERQLIETRRRPKSIVLKKEGLGSAVVRDQFPMDDKGLLRCLQDGLSPQDWYKLLNGKVFFWLTRTRLLRLLNAGTYRNEEHDVLELEASPLLAAYKDKSWFCPMNSGCTKPFPHPRGKSTFRRIFDYPYEAWRAKRPRGERVVELAVDYAVPDIEKFVKRVVRMKGNSELAVVFEAKAGRVVARINSRGNDVPG
jgi:hypothetical protein